MPLPTITKPLNLLWKEDLLPYRQLAKQLPMVMVSHASYSAAVPEPASVSAYWITEVLVREIGYQGLIVSDDMEMGGILNYMGIADAAIRSLAAGMHVVEICRDPALVFAAYEALLHEAESFAGLCPRASPRGCPGTVVPYHAPEEGRAATSSHRGCGQKNAQRGGEVYRAGRQGMSELTSMTVAGIMSGTSADGIDVAFTRITPDPKDAAFPQLKLLAHAGFPFPPALRRAVLAAMNAEAIATAELARLNWRLGQAYSEALTVALERNPCRLDLIGCHGQTIYHQATPVRYLGREATCTWQIGEMAMLAEQSGVPVVSNFRPADMVVGGQGAPLVPLLDYVLFRHPTRGRVLQNLGGIGNLTALPRQRAGPCRWWPSTPARPTW